MHESPGDVCWMSQCVVCFVGLRKTFLNESGMILWRSKLNRPTWDCLNNKMETKHTQNTFGLMYSRRLMMRLKKYKVSNLKCSPSILFKDAFFVLLLLTWWATTHPSIMTLHMYDFATTKLLNVEEYIHMHLEVDSLMYCWFSLLVVYVASLIVTWLVFASVKSTSHQSVVYYFYLASCKVFAPNVQLSTCTWHMYPCF